MRFIQAWRTLIKQCDITYLPLEVEISYKVTPLAFEKGLIYTIYVNLDTNLGFLCYYCFIVEISSLLSACYITRSICLLFIPPVARLDVKCLKCRNISFYIDFYPRYIAFDF